MGVVSMQYELGNLLGASANTEADLVLPKFTNDVKLFQNKEMPEFTYHGNSYSDRDTRSAFQVSNLLSQLINLRNINIKDTFDFDLTKTKSQLIFVFGSKSNVVTQRLMTLSGKQNIFNLEFGDNWTIHSSRSGKNYSIKDPSILNREEYENSTDYGIIARYKASPTVDKTTFIIAGLGSRATEGCGIYFASNWELVNLKFGNAQIAAVILKFPAPVSPSNVEVAEWVK